jgi:hypothetical protein
MKKYALAAIIIILLLIGLGYTYFASKESPKNSTKESVARLFSQKYNRPASALIIEVTADTGKFAKGTYNEIEGGGGLWFLAKTQNGWELVSAGNGIVACGDIEKYDFPRDMVPACIDTQNGNNLIQR